MNRAAKLVIVIEDNNVQEVYAPAGLDIQYFSIDRDDQSEEELHVAGWRDAMTHADLLQHNKQYFRLAFGRKKPAELPNTDLISRREAATVLAALRFWQRSLPKDVADFGVEHFVDQKPLSEKEIDELCIRINCEW